MRAKKRMYGTYESKTRTLPDGQVVRICVFCGEELPIERFPKNGVDANGAPRYRQDCRTCYNVRRRENSQRKVHTDFVGGMKRRGEVDVSYSHEDWKQTVIFFKGQCAYCGRTMKKGERLTRDHLMPVSEGGVTTQDNIVPACHSCNSSKGATEWREWFMKQPFFSQERMNHIFEWRAIIRAAGEGGSGE